MKTFKEIFQELPEDIREKAIKNTDTLNIYINSETEDESDLSNALRRAFPWRSSPEGYEYWESVHLKYSKE